MAINGFSNNNLGKVFDNPSQPEITHNWPPDELISSSQKASYEMEKLLNLDDMEKLLNLDDMEKFLDLDQDLEQLERDFLLYENNHPPGASLNSSDSLQSETTTNSLKRNRPETEVDGIPIKRKRWEFLAKKIEDSGLKLKEAPIPPPYINNPLDNHDYKSHKFQSFYDSKDITENQRRYLINLIIENITTSYYHSSAETKNSNGLTKCLLLSLDPDSRLLENDNNGLLKLEPLHTWKRRYRKNNADSIILEIPDTNVPYRSKAGNIIIITRIILRILAHEQFSGFKEENKALIGRLTYRINARNKRVAFLEDLYTMQNALASYPFSDFPNVLTNIIDL
jgi:hypothetical protein